MPERLPNLPFHLHTQPNADDGFIVSKIEGRERLSDVYEWNLECVWNGQFADLPPVGLAAILRIDDSDYADTPPRLIHGILEDVTFAGTDYNRTGSWFSVRLVPRLWKARESRRRRIFQSLSVQQIVDQVLTAYGATTRWQVSPLPPPFAFCVQYDESDFDFVQRLLGRFGFFYYFDQPQADPADVETAETIVIAQRVQDYAATERSGSPSPLVLKLADREGTARSIEAINNFQATQRAAPVDARQRDWDMRVPSVFGDFAAPPATNHPPLASDPLLVEEFEQRNANDTVKFGASTARTFLEQHRSRWASGSGTSDCILLETGRRFVLDNHEISALNVPWLATQVVHQGHVPEWMRNRRKSDRDMPPFYGNTFECVPASIPARMPVKERESMRGTESAVVVGPAGEEIFTDEYGRIKIQFMWDRDGQYNDQSSCWVRVALPWVGPGFGFQFVPRIGMEVLISFQGGDPDHPVVIGCLNNAMLMPTHDLPLLKSRSGVRTNSIGSTGGFNELMFEDAVGNEVVRVTAQRDLEEVVKENRSQRVGGSDTTQVGGSRTVTIAASQDVKIGGSSRLASGEATEEIAGNRSTQVSGTLNTQVGEHSALQVKGNESRIIKGNQALDVEGERIATFGGSTLDAVRKDVELHVAGSHRIYVDKDIQQSVGGDHAVTITGKLTITTVGGVTLVCGNSTLDIGTDAVTITSKTVTLAGSDAVNIGPKAITITGSDHITLDGNSTPLTLDGDAKLVAANIKFKSSGAKLTLDSNATVEAGSVKLKSGSGDSASDSSNSSDDSSTSTQSTNWVIKIVDPLSARNNPQPLSNALVTATGHAPDPFQGTTDGSGIVRIPIVKKTCIISLQGKPTAKSISRVGRLDGEARAPRCGDGKASDVE